MNENGNNKKFNFKKEDIYAFILLVLFVFWTVASVLGVIAFTRDNGSRDNKVVASAFSVTDEDTIVKIEEGVFEIPLLGLLGDINSLSYGQLYTVNGQYLTLICDNDGINIRRYINNGTDTQLQTLYEDFGILTLSNSVPVTVKSFISSTGGYADFSFTASILQSSIIQNFDGYVPYRVSYKFLPTVDNSSAIDIKIDWFDTSLNRNDFSMEIRLLASGPISNVYSSYFSFFLQSDYSDYMSHRCDLISAYDYFKYQGDSYQVGYGVGQQVGYNNGYDVGYGNGRTDGYNIGLSDGKDIGFNQGLAQGGDVSWFNLFTSWFDVPIQALTGLFNFELLGINLWSFLRAIFTVVVIVAVVKFIL